MISNLEKHYTVLGALFIGLGIMGVIGIFVLLAIFGTGSVILGGVASQDPSVPRGLVFLPLAFALFISFCIAISTVPNFVAAYGLLTGRRWAPIMTLVAGILNLPNIPLGTGVGIYAIWLFVQNQGNGGRGY